MAYNVYVRSDNGNSADGELLSVVRKAAGSAVVAHYMACNTLTTKDGTFVIVERSVNDVTKEITLWTSEGNYDLR